MTEQNKLAVRGGHSEDMALAEAIYKSGYFVDVKSAQQALVKILAGREFGIGAVSAMNSIYISQKGVPAPTANLMAALVKHSGKYNYKVKELTDERCVLDFYENGELVGTSAFGKEDAERAGLLGKETYKKYPRNLFFARALSNGAKWYCPDSGNGMPLYVPEELEIDEREETDEESSQRATVIVNNQVTEGAAGTEQQVVVEQKQPVTDDSLLSAMPDKLARFNDTASKLGYDLSIVKVSGGLIHLVNPDKFKAEQLTYREAKLLFGYFKLQEGLKGKELTAKKDLGKVVLMRAVTNNEDWDMALANSKQITEKMPEPDRGIEAV